MVFREQTELQVKSIVAEMEKTPPKVLDAVYDAQRRESMPTIASPSNKESKLPTGRHAMSCLSNNLFHSVYKCRLKKVKFFLDNGLNINTVNDYGYNVLVAALHIEPDSSRSKMFRYLLERDADPMQRDPKYTRSVLGWAIVMGRTEQVALLLDFQMGEFDLHEKDRDGMSPLHLATQGGHVEIVKALVSEMVRYGKTVDITDNLGLTPYLHAKRLGYGYIADILKDEGSASVGQGDMFSFKRADEWRDIGIKERNMMARQRRDSQYEQAAISGSHRLLNLFEQPGYEVINLENETLYKRDKGVKESQTTQRDGTTRCVRVVSPKSQYSLPDTSPRRSIREIREMNRPTPSSVNSSRPDVMSLIQWSPSVKGQVPRHFHSSQLDTRKTAHYKTILDDLATMMEYLSEQQTKSFRESVPPLRLRHASDKDKDKKSTLAIIFGKKQRGKKSHKAGGSGGKKSSGSGKGRSSRA